RRWLLVETAPGPSVASYGGQCPYWISPRRPFAQPPPYSSTPPTRAPTYAPPNLWSICPSCGEIFLCTVKSESSRNSYETWHAYLMRRKCPQRGSPVRI